MIGTDRATASRPSGSPEALAAPLYEPLADFSAEYVVEWQVADHAALITDPGTREANPL